MVEREGERDKERVCVCVCVCGWCTVLDNVVFVCVCALLSVYMCVFLFVSVCLHLLPISCVYVQEEAEGMGSRLRLKSRIVTWGMGGTIRRRGHKTLLTLTEHMCV